MYIIDPCNHYCNCLGLSFSPILIALQLLTVFLVTLLIQVDVGLHVPDELMCKQLGFLCSPQYVFTHIAHLSRTRCVRHEIMSRVSFGRTVKRAEAFLPCHTGALAQFVECRKGSHPYKGKKKEIVHVD